MFVCMFRLLFVSLQSYHSSKEPAALGNPDRFCWASSRGNMCVKLWGYNYSLGLTFASSAVTSLRWQPFLGCCQGTKHFFSFCLSPADPLEADDHKVSESFSKTGGSCTGHEAGCFSVKTSLVLTMNKSSVRRRLSFIYEKSIAFKIEFILYGNLISKGEWLTKPFHPT